MICTLSLPRSGSSAAPGELHGQVASYLTATQPLRLRWSRAREASVKVRVEEAMPIESVPSCLFQKLPSMS